MKKITLVAQNTRARETVARLGELGVLHLDHVGPPRTSEIDRLNEQRGQVVQALSILTSRKGKPNRGTPPREDSALEIAAHILALEEERTRLQDHFRGLSLEHDRMAPFGEFSPADLERLRRHGLNARLFRCNKSDLEAVDKQGVTVAVVGRAKREVYVMAVGLEDFQFPGEEWAVPDKGPGELAEERGAVRATLQHLEEELDRWTDAVAGLRAFLDRQSEQIEFVRAVSSMGEEGGLSYLRGYCPAPEMIRLRQETLRNGWALMVEEPPENEDVPTLIENPAWLGIVQPVFDLMGTVPGYREYDVSFWFLISLSLFCAMLVGDGAYGLLLCLGTCVLQLTLRRFPPRLIALLYVFSGATVLWGLLTGTWFGVEGLARTSVLRHFIVPSLYSFSDNQNLMIHLCFLIGAVHLTIAHAIRLLRVIRSWRALAELGWIVIIWSLFFLADYLVLRRPLPPMGIYLLPTGVLLTAFFADPQRGLLKSFFVTLADLPLNVIRSFSDVVSYLRLFAVGYATFVVATSFNKMATELGWDSLPGAVGATVVLVVGHSLNIILGGMAVLVHGIRLNMLEFSSHMEMAWSGRAFSPFALGRGGKGWKGAGTDKATEGDAKDD